jgi:hypothetical protein
MRSSNVHEHIRTLVGRRALRTSRDSVGEIVEGVEHDVAFAFLLCISRVRYLDLGRQTRKLLVKAMRAYVLVIHGWSRGKRVSIRVGALVRGQRTRGTKRRAASLRGCEQSMRTTTRPRVGFVFSPKRAGWHSPKVVDRFSYQSMTVERRARS